MLRKSHTYDILNNSSHPQTSMKKYYTYAYVREDATPYYVGKGSGRRIDDPSHHSSGIPPKNRRIYLKQNITEEEALRHEVYMISVLGRKDLGTGILRNLTDGGDGTSGYKHTEEWKKVASERMRGKPSRNQRKTLTEEEKRRISESMKGIVHSPQSIEKMRQSKMGHKVSDEARQKISAKNKGKVWYNDGKINRFTHQSPGKGWVKGRLSFKKK